MVGNSCHCCGGHLAAVQKSDIKMIKLFLYQAYAVNGDQLLGGKTARSYAAVMDKARYLQKDIEVEIR